MKKQLLLILALLAFILPARAEQGVDPYMLYNFRNNDKATDYGTSFGTSVALTNVFATVVGNDVTSFSIDNAPDYVGAITEASNVSYNSKGGIYMKAGGKFTFTLKKSYKVKEYQFMGRQANGTTAIVTVNGVSFDGPTATIESGTFSRLYPTPASPTEINAITISSDKDVFIKSIGIYVEAEEAKHKAYITPPSGTYGVGQQLTASCVNDTDILGCYVTKEGTEGNYDYYYATGTYNFTFTEAGKYTVEATAYSSDYTEYSETVTNTYIITDGTAAVLSVDKESGSYKLPMTVNVGSTKADDRISLTLADENSQTIANGTFTGSWSYTFTVPGTFVLTASNNDGSEIYEIYEVGYAPQGPTFELPNGDYPTGTQAKVTSRYATKLAVKIIKKADFIANGFNAEGTKTIYNADNHTVALTEDIVLVAQGENEFGKTNTEYRRYNIQTVTPTEKAAAPTYSIATGSEVNIGDVVTVSSETAGAQLAVTRDGTTVNVASPYSYTFAAADAGKTVSFSAVATASGYLASDAAEATYSVKAPEIPTVAPVITFSHEDQKVFGTNEEIDVTLSLNADVYPVPDVIYYTLDGYSAHNTIEAGEEGASPEGRILTIDVDPTTLSGIVRIVEDHRTALRHRSVTINAYAVNTAGADVAAATYIFNDDSQPEPSTVTAVVTMANQGWTNGTIYGKDENVDWKSDNNENSVELTFSTIATISINNTYPAYNASNDPKGLRLYASSGNVLTVNAPSGYAIKSVKPTFNVKSSATLKLNDATITSGSTKTFDTAVTSFKFTPVTNQVALVSIEFVLEKSEAAAKAAPVRRAAATDVFNLVTDASQIKAGDEIIIASHYVKTGKSADDNYYVLKSIDKKGTGVKDTNLKNDNTKLTASDYLVFTVESDGKKASDGTSAYLLKNSTNYLTASNNDNGLSLAAKSDQSYVTITNGESGWGDNAMNVHFFNCGSAGNLMAYIGTTFNAYKNSSCSNRTSTTDQYSNIILYRKAVSGDPGLETVKTPTITVSEQTESTDAVTVTLACETEGATILYTVNDGDEQTYSAPFTISDPGSYTIKAYAMKDGMNNSAAATPVSFSIAKPARVPEAVEELFLVMAKNFWNVDGKYPETVVPFVYNAEQGYYDLDISAIPATGTYGEDAINGGFMGEFYVRDGKANNLGLVFSAEAPVSAANMMAAYAVTPAQKIEQGVEYNMSVKPAEAASFKKFTTSNIAYKNGTLRVTYTPGKKDASAVKTLQILNSETVTGINAAIADSDAPVEYFNLQGVRIAYPLAGQILIRRQGDKVEKIRF